MPTIDGSKFLRSVVKKIQIPPQLRLEDVPKIDSSKNAVGKSLKAVLGVDIILKLLLTGSLGKIWSLFNELQIVENMNLFDLKIPGSWSYFAMELEDLTNFKFIGIYGYIEEFFYVPEQTPLSLNF